MDEFTNVSVLLALDTESSLDECITSVRGALDRLTEFIANGHSTDGLSFTYSKIEKY